MKYLLTVIALSLVLVACSTSAAEEPAGEPWIVTGTSWVRDGDTESVIVVQYTVPGGVGEWRRGLPTSTDATEAWLRCWYTAELGAPVPDCIRKDTPPR